MLNIPFCEAKHAILHVTIDLFIFNIFVLMITLVNISQCLKFAAVSCVNWNKKLNIVLKVIWVN